MGPRAAGDLAPTCPQDPPSVRPPAAGTSPDVPPRRPALHAPRPPLGPRPTCPKTRPLCARPPLGTSPDVPPRRPALCAPARRWDLPDVPPRRPAPSMRPARRWGPRPTCPQGAPPSVRPARRWGPPPTCPQGAPPLCGDWARPRACPGSPPRPGSLGVKKIGAYLQRPSYEATHALRVSHPGLSGHRLGRGFLNSDGALAP